MNLTTLQAQQSGAKGDSWSPFTLYAYFVVAATVFLIFVGALVTTKGAGLAVPDWPLSFGQLNPKMEGGVFYEHGHRMVASGVGFLTLVLAFWAQFTAQASTVRRLAWFALGLVIVQGLLGGLTVLYRLPRPISIAHACTAQMFLCTLVAVALYATPRFRGLAPKLYGDRAYALRLAGFLAVASIMVQLLVAATMRHMGAGLVIGDFPTSLGRWIPPFDSAEIAINFTHRVMALVVLALVSFFVWRVHRESLHLPRALPWLARAVMALVLLQIGLGAYTVWSARGVIPTSWHVVNGALVLSATFACWLWTLRATGHGQGVLSGRLDRASGLEVAPSLETAPPLAMRVTGKDWAELFKAKLVTMSVITAALAFWAGRGYFDPLALFQVSLGVALIGAGAGALNELLEIEVDLMMARTRNRPLPTGRIAPATAEFLGCSLSVLGVLYLGLSLHPLAGLLAALAVVLYAFVYTPMKKLSPYCTLVGAVPGALPVLVGWSAATGGLEVQGWILFLILFLWQLPHFMAIAWLCKEDYRQARLPMVTVLDPGGTTAATQAIIYALVLLPVSLAPALYGLGGAGYAATALVLGLIYLYAGASWAFDRTTPKARRLLLTSVFYLPALFGAMVVW